MAILVTSLGFLIEDCLGLKRENPVRWKLWCCSQGSARMLVLPFHSPCKCAHPFQIHVTVFTHLKCESSSTALRFSIAHPRTGWCGIIGPASHPVPGFLCLYLLRLNYRWAAHTHLLVWYLHRSWDPNSYPFACLHDKHFNHWEISSAPSVWNFLSAPLFLGIGVTVFQRKTKTEFNEPCCVPVAHVITGRYYTRLLLAFIGTPWVS